MTDDHAWIDREAGLDELASAMRDAPWIALDSESNSMFVYRERICLLQINAGGRRFVVDSLALPYRAETYAAIKPVLEDPAKPVYVHGGEYDVICLKRDFAIAMRGVWDSQQAASMLGWERTGYGAVVERLCGVALDKAYTQYDWATRPLHGDALRYAVDDVRYLPEVSAQLRAAVVAADLEEELSLANEAVMGAAWGGGFDPAGFWRVKGVRELPERALPTLASLYVWRDRVAEKRNLPPGRMLNNEAMLALARSAPTNFPGLRRFGLKSWMLSEHGEELIALMKSVRDQPPAVPDPPRHRQVDDAERRREDRLKDWRRSEAARRQVPLQVVLPAKALEHLKRYSAADLAAVPQLGAKRIGLYGEKLRLLCS